MVCLPAEFKASLDLRRPALAKGPHRGCPPPRGATVKAIDSAALENLESMALTFLRGTDAWETWKANGAAAA
jgi:hypothetical protein